MTNARWTRVVPISFLIYTVAFMDRVNIGFATHGMAEAFDAPPATIGLALGIFFIGYSLLQLPAGYIADRWGAKIWITLLLIMWGIFAVASGLARTLTEEMIARFFLGAAEGGLWPAILIMLARWFPKEERASANALFQMSLPVGALISAPLSGWIVSAWGWREMLVLEGLPPFIWAILWWLLVVDRPADAKWLSEAERHEIESRLAKESEAMAPVPLSVGWKGLVHPMVWALSGVYFFSIIGSYGLQLWGPTIIKNAGVSYTMVGILLAIPNIVGIVAMLITARLSDLKQRRKFFVSLAMAATGISLVLFAVVPNIPVWLMIVLMSVATAGIFARQAPLWTIPTQILPVGAAGLAMALISLLGNLGGFVGPWIMGGIQGVTGSFQLGFIALAACMGAAILLIAVVPENKPLELDSSFSRTIQLLTSRRRPSLM